MNRFVRFQQELVYPAGSVRRFGTDIKASGTVICTRVTQEQLEEIEEAANKLGITRSRYMSIVLQQVSSSINDPSLEVEYE
jgi:hypothetical protein